MREPSRIERAVLLPDLVLEALRGSATARAAIGRVDAPALSVLSWLEILDGARDEEQEETFRRFLRRFPRLPVDEAVAEEARRIRRESGASLREAIPRATARVVGVEAVGSDGTRYDTP